MKHSFKTLLTIALALVAGNVWGETEYTQVSQLDLTTKSVACASYNTSTVYGDWTIVNGANNNKGWAYFKMGGKSATLSSANPCYIYSTKETTEQIDKITVSIVAGSLPKSGMSVNSWGLYVYSDANMSTQIDFVEGGAIQSSAAIYDFIPSTGKTWAAGYYYKVSWDLANTTTTNGIVFVDKITLYKAEGATPSKTLESIAISGNPTKTSYEMGDSFDPVGLVVTGTYDDDSTADLTEDAEWTITPATFTATTETSVSVTAKVGTISSAAFNVTGLTVTEHVVTPGTYTFGTDWNSVFGTSYDGSFSAKANELTLKGEVGDVAMVVANGTSTNAYIKTGDFRLYNGYTMTISAPDGYDITSITATKGGKTISSTTADCGSLTIAADGSTMEWTGASNTVVFSVATTIGFASISVTFAVPTTDPIISANDITIEADATSGEIAYTIDNPVSGKNVTASTTAEWISNIQVTDEKVTFTTTTNTGAERQATITLKYDGASDKDVTVTQKKAIPTYASLEALVAASGEDWPTTTGETVKVTFSNVVITDIYVTSKGYRNGIFVDVQTPSGNDVEIYCNNVPTEWEVGGKVSATLICPWKKYNDTWELCPASWNDITYTSSKTLTSVAVSGTPTKTSYQEGDAFDPAGLVVTGTYDDASTDDTMASQTVWSCTPATLTEGTTSVTVTATVNGITSDAYVVNGITVEAKTPTGNFALYTGTFEEGDYVIYYNGNAMKASVSSNRLDYESVTPTGNVIAEPDASIVWHIAASGDYYTIYNVAEEKYAASNGTKNQAALVASETDNALWSISYVGGYEFVNKVNAGKGVNANLRNNSTYGFACYSTSTGGALKLYKKTDAATPVREHGATITSAGFATLYLDFAAAIPTGVTAYTAVAAEDAVTLTEIEDVIPAETAVVLEGAAGTYTFEETTTTATAPANNLVGTLTATDWETVNNGKFIYVLGQKDDVVGFYKLSETGAIKANSAYLALDEDPASGSIIIRKGDATAISLVQENGGEAVIYDLLGRRVSEPMRGIYIVNGKKMFIK